jgi:hypothetical protein
MGKYMSGITFFEDSIQAKLFLGGSYAFIEEVTKSNQGFSMSLNFGSMGSVLDDPADPNSWKTNEELFSTNIAITMDNVSSSLPSLPMLGLGDDYTYKGIELPNFLGEMDVPVNSGMAGLIAALPKDLRFFYQLTNLPETLTATREMFDDDDGSGGLKALLVMMVRLELQAEPGAFIRVPDDVFESGKDLFERESLDDDSIFNEMNVKTLKLRIDFDSTLFHGAFLHIDSGKNADGEIKNREDTLFPDGLKFGSNNRIEVTASSNDWKIIRNNLIYPEIRIEFPDPGGKIVIPRGKSMLPTRITIAVSGSFILDLDNLGLGN